MFGALLMPQGVGLFAGCGTALLSMKRKQPRDEEDPEPNPDPPDCAGYGASPSEGKRQMLGRMAQNRCEELNPTMYFCSLACPAHPWLTLGLRPLALAQRRKRASLNACRFAGAVLDDDDQTLQPQQAPEAPGTSAGSSTAEQPHTSPTEQQSTATLMPPRTYADALMAQNPVLAQPVRTVVAQPLPPSTAQRPLGPPSSQTPPELMMPSMSPFYPSTTATGAACTSGNASTQTLQSIFMTRVMCDFTPRRPSSLPTWKWATLEQLLDRLALHSPREVFQLGPNSLRQLITEWYKDHPAFAGLPYTAWGKRLKDMDPAAHPRSLVFKFSFEYTPAGQPLPMPPSPPSRPAGPGGPSSSAGYSATYFGP